MEKIVFSRTLKQVAWNSRLASGDIAETVNRMKAQPGKDMTVGGASLAASFMRLGLIDEYWLFIRPVILGGGRPMFPHLNDMIHLQLAETRALSSGVVLLKYQQAK